MSDPLRSSNASIRPLGGGYFLEAGFCGPAGGRFLLNASLRLPALVFRLLALVCGLRQVRQVLPGLRIVEP